jgi:hypothetical protein
MLRWGWLWMNLRNLRECPLGILVVSKVLEYRSCDQRWLVNFGQTSLTFCAIRGGPQAALPVYHHYPFANTSRTIYCFHYRRLHICSFLLPE